MIVIFLKRGAIVCRSQKRRCCRFWLLIGVALHLEVAKSPGWLMTCVSGRIKVAGSPQEIRRDFLGGVTSLPQHTATRVCARSLCLLASILQGYATADEFTGVPRADDPRDRAPNASQPSTRHVVRTKTTTTTKTTDLPPLPDFDSDQPFAGGYRSRSAVRETCRAGCRAQRGSAGPRRRCRRRGSQPSPFCGERRESGPASTGPLDRGR